MVDIEKQVAYWQQGATEDWDVAKTLLDEDKIRHGLFFAHLALEKVLKALVCRHTGKLAPRTHNLMRLSELTNLTLDETQFDTLADMNAFNLEGRYPDQLLPSPSTEEANEYLKRADEVYQWLMSQL